MVYTVELNDNFFKENVLCVFFLTNIFSALFWTSLILRLELLPFEFQWGLFFFEFFSQTYLGRRVELTTF